MKGLNTICLLILFLVSLKSYAQSSVSEFYLTKGILLDSVTEPYLYYKGYEWIGTKYRYAGHTSKGIDCSGFSQMLYKEVYCKTITGGSKDMWSQVMPVAQDSLQEGDFVFFKIKRGRISHVGVYLTNGKFIHASVKSGVIVSSLQEPYYKKYYFSGGRINTTTP